MREPLGYHIFIATGSAGGLWLQSDERTWAPSFHDAASFTDGDFATEIAERETGDGSVMEGQPFYVLACMPS